MSWGAPDFWWPRPDAPRGLGSTLTETALLLPSLAYGRLVAARMASPGRQAALPTVCVGNFVAGGAGKTPTALALADLLRAERLAPAFISRGYGGSLATGSLQVDGSTHKGREVGDEPLLLAASAPTWVGPDRLASIDAAAGAGADVAVLDDGLQNPTVTKNLTIAVVDGTWGTGNGHCHPAGPLRAPLAVQMDHCDMLVVIGAGPAARPAVRLAAKRGKPVLPARMVLSVPNHLHGKPLVAYCGIGRPDKFFASLREEGLDVVQGLHFADHHPYRPGDAERLVREAQSRNALLVTTAKDMARLRGATGVLKDLAAVSTAVPAQLVFEDSAYVGMLLREAIARWRRDLLLVKID